MHERDFIFEEGGTVGEKLAPDSTGPGLFGGFRSALSHKQLDVWNSADLLISAGEK